MLRWVLFLFVIIMFINSCYTINRRSLSLHRRRRFLFLFPFYRILPGDPCVGSTNLRGICITQRQCNARGGICSGSCSNSKGVCCIYQNSCGSSTNANLTYFVNPNFPTSVTNAVTCSITVNKMASYICQLRVDFLDVSVGEPNGMGQCNNDFIFLDINLPKVCGENTGQHMYINYADGSTAHTITVATTSSSNANRRWNLLITQIGCNSTERAPVGCAKFYTSAQGSDMSFNYSPAQATAGGTDSRQIANLNYGVCVKPGSGYCGIQWSSQSSDAYSFTVSLNADTELGTAKNGTDCQTNYVVIPDPYKPGSSTPLLYDRFCGTAFNSVISMSRPFVLTVVTTNNITGKDLNDRGYHLSFKQIECNTVSN